MNAPAPQVRTDLEVSGFAHPDGDTWLLHFVWPTNPLPMNGSRGHWRKHASLVRDVRDTAQYRIRAAGIPLLGRVRAQLTWWAPDRRVRDADNLAQLEKPLFDALVREGVVADDRPELMDKPRAIIRHHSESEGLVTGSGFVLTVTKLAPEETR